jgi:hypothetical protein
MRWSSWQRAGAAGARGGAQAAGPAGNRRFHGHGHGGLSRPGGPRRAGIGETVYLEVRQAGDDTAMRQDLALREAPKVTALGHVARGHVVNRQEWTTGGTREQLRRTLQSHRPSKRWRIVQVSLFSVGEAYLKLVHRPATN